MKKPGLALLISAGKMGKSSGSDESYSDGKAMREEASSLIKAIQNEDPKAVAESIKTLVSLCSDSEEEKSEENEEED